MTPKLFRSDETRQWLRHARDDLTAAVLLTNASPPLLKLALFHCQQAVEKALKAFLVWHDQPFHKTHDLVTLADQCIGLDQTLETILNPALQLSQYAVKLRYPGETKEPTTDETLRWLPVASSVLEAVVHRLPEEFRDLE